MLIPCDKFYSRSYCTHQSHISMPLHTTFPPSTVQCNTTIVGARHCLLILLSLDFLTSISFCYQALVFQHHFAVIDTSESTLL
jgi:hypothetical protein